jgi:Serine-threonine protein phosphatase N-terminal domain
MSHTYFYVYQLIITYSVILKVFVSPVVITLRARLRLMWDLHPTSLNFSFNRLKPNQLDEWIERLLSTKMDDNFLLYSHEVVSLCKAAVKLLKKEPCLLKLDPAKYHIVGDVHGQYQDLQRIITTHGLPPTTRYIFLGDYVSRFF